MKQLQRFLCHTLVVFTFTIVLSGCDSEVQTSEKKVFRYNETEILSSLDPAFATFLPNHWAVNQLYNAPLEFNEKLEIQPCLAKSWDVLDGGKTYRLTIRNDVFFHDHKLFKNGKGRKMTAYDLQYTLRRVCDTTDIYNKGLWVFKDKVLKTDQGLISDTTFLAKNDTIFMVHLEKPVPNFLQILCMPFCFVVPKEVAGTLEKDFGREPVGTGPFKFGSWDNGNKLIYLKNENYWKKDSSGMQLPYLDAVEVSFISDESQFFRAYELGYFDFISRMNEAVLGDVLYPDGSVKEEITEKYKVIKSPYMATDYIAFVIDKEAEIYQDRPNHPMLNKDFRKALNYTVDRKRIVTLLRNGLGIAGESGIVPPAMPYFDTKQVKGYGFDPKLGQEYLRKTGFKKEDFSGLKLTVAKQYKDVSEFLVKTWKETLGIDIEIELKEGKVIIDESRNGRLSFCKQGWLGDYPDGENFLSLFATKSFAPSGPNRSRFSSAKFDSLLELTSLENDPAVRGKIYQEMDQIMIDEAPVIVLYYNQIIGLTTKQVSGFNLDPMNGLYLEKVRVE